jgi:hypothetical protein
MLSEALLGLVLRTPSGHRALRTIFPSQAGDPYYLFLVLPKYETIPDDKYRLVREQMLQAACQVLKLTYPDALHVVGIATELGTDPDKSEDAVYLDCTEWTAEMEVEARRLQRELDLFTHVKMYRQSENEYPEPNARPKPLHGPRTISRNAKCPCKSGKRYRYCCGKSHFDRKKRPSPSQQP